MKNIILTLLFIGTLLSISVEADGKRANVGERSLQPKQTVTKPLIRMDGCFRTLPYGHHFIAAKSEDAEYIEFEDGSLWAVNAGDRKKVLLWLSSDDLQIVPGGSAGIYTVVNLTSNTRVGVILSQGPFLQGHYAHWIALCDTVKKSLMLNDGSVWHVSLVDASRLKNWMENDSIIIGINEGLSSYSNPYILIDVEMNEYVRVSLQK